MANPHPSSRELRFSPNLTDIWEHVSESAFPAGSAEESTSSRRVTGSVVLIDGASGTGKTSLAAHLASRWPENRPVVVVHMDDLYGGWTGLAAGILALDVSLFGPRSRGEEARLRAYNWGTGRWEDGLTIPAHVDVIVEGCGSFGAAESPSSATRIWLDAPLDVRRERALSRGGEDFDRHWDAWERQFEQYERRAQPAALASLQVSANR